MPDLVGAAAAAVPGVIEEGHCVEVGGGAPGGV